MTRGRCWLLCLAWTFVSGVVVHAASEAAAQAAYGFVALNTSSSSKCAAGPLNVLFRISSCFQLSEVVAIDNWIGTSIRSSISPFPVNVTIYYYARLENPAAPSDCDPGTTRLTATSFQRAIKAMKYNPGLPFAFANAVINIVKDSGQLSSITPRNPIYAAQLRFCDGSCSMLPTDTVFSIMYNNVVSGPIDLVRYILCYHITDAAPFSYVGTSNRKQCDCVCPVGTVLIGTTCSPVLTDEAEGTCSWNVNRPAGYTCQWSNASASALKLVSDCKVDIVVPFTNYYNVKSRVNKNDNVHSPTDPKIEVVSSIAKTSLVDTWQEFLLQPQQELDSIELRSFGVHSISISAFDDDREWSCDGCVAVVDNFPPHAVQSCATTGWGSKADSPTDLTLANLWTAMGKEANFTAFSSAQNVVNNGPSERVDIVTRTMKDWVSSSYADVGSDTPCFHYNVVLDLLNQASLTDYGNLSRMSSTALSDLRCMRCCSKLTTLREYYYDYKCGPTSSPAAKLIAGNETCTFDHCMQLTGASLVQVSASTMNTVTSGDPTLINRASNCLALSASCTYTATLASLLSVSAAWDAALPNPDGSMRGFNVSAFVFWRFKRGSDDWVVWNDSAVLTFTTASTALSVQAWTRCGMAKQLDFTVAVSVLPALSTFPTFTMTSRAGTSTTIANALSSLTAVPAACLSNEAMAGFQLNSVSGNNAYYSTQCVSSSTGISTGATKTTAYTSISSTPNDVTKLSAHVLDCETAAINSFKLEASSSTIRYSYTCTAALNPTSCIRTVVTASTNPGSGASSLDRQNVACPTDMFMAKTQLMYDAKGVWYQSMCCFYQRTTRTRTSYSLTIPTAITGLAALPASCTSGEGMRSVQFDYITPSYTTVCLADGRLVAGAQLYTTWVANSGSIFALANLAMDCGSDVLNGFQLESNNGMIRYAYSCAKVLTASTVCSTATTANTGLTTNTTSSLDTMAATCAAGYLLTKLQLQMQSAGTYIYSPAYQYTCCQRP